MTDFADTYLQTVMNLQTCVIMLSLAVVGPALNTSHAQQKGSSVWELVGAC
jgi:hypothetical protein